MRRPIPLWLSIIWWLSALALCLYWEVVDIGSLSMLQLHWMPMLAWMLCADMMVYPVKPYPRWT